MKRYANFDLSSRNTFRMKVRCALYLEITEESDLPALDWAALPQPVMVMGGGSNLLFTKDFPGTVLHVGIGGGETPFGGRVHPRTRAGGGARWIQVPEGDAVDNGRGRSERSERSSSEGSLSVTVPAGVVFDEFCAWAAGEGLWGPENLSLIPGEVGASAVQNIGAYGVEAKDIIADIRAWDRVEGRFVHIDPATCGYGYRTSKFKTEWKGRYIITAVTYRLSREPKPVLDYGGIRKALPEGPLTPQIIRDTIIGIRNQKLPDPAVTGSAGSFFCNPVISREHFARIVAIAQKDNGPEYQVPHYEVGDQIKVPAAWMIEQCGFKGAVNGGAQVYPKQPLVIVNASGEASPQEIIGLEQRIIDTIAGKYGITLHPEVEHI
ncbi:MAG: UDP-N-acetylmuramate dehydrogenase [Bacteroidales bacterium]|nr:UDP-N-acetylmuramate dehydrogenase [Bacteroidales bacterium]